MCQSPWAAASVYWVGAMGNQIAAELNSMCSSALTNTGDENGEEEKGSGD